MPFPYNELWGLPPIYSRLQGIQPPSPLAARSQPRTPSSPRVSEEARLRAALLKARMQGSNPDVMAGIDSPVINPGAYGLESLPQEQGTTFLPGEEEQILRSGMNEGKMEGLDRQYSRAQAMRDSELPMPDRITLSSGTSYQPATSDAAVLAHALKQAVGNYGMNRAEKKRKKLDKREKEAARLWAKRMAEGPKTPMAAEILGNIERDQAKMKAPQVDLGEPTLWDRLRRSMR